MTMKITAKTTLSDIAGAFAQAFPYLKLAFFMRQRGKWVEAEQNAAPLSTSASEILLNLDPERTVKDLLSELQSLLQLEVMILRRSGRLYIETSVTEDWTLQRQNDEGAELSQTY